MHIDIKKTIFLNVEYIYMYIYIQNYEIKISEELFAVKGN